MSSDESLTQVAVGRQPDEEDIRICTPRLASKTPLRQTRLFEFGVPALDSSNAPQYRRKRAADYETDAPQDSIQWGDHLPLGSEIDSNTFRILSHNVNGLSTADSHADVRDFARSIQNKSIALFGIQETNRNFQRKHLVTSFHNAVRGVSTHHKGAVSSARLDWDSDYQPGGTAISVCNKWATRYLADSSDSMGRWSTITLTGKGTTKITFISAYRVCDGAHESSITARTARSQQEWIYADRGMPKTNLRDQFVADAIKLINELQQKGHDIVLMMDANEASCINSGIDKICFQCSLTDAHTRATTTIPPPATYHRGTTKIDFILVSSRLVPAIKAATILALHDGYLSDHRALVIDIDALALFGGTTSSVIAPVSRRLTSTNPSAVHKYMAHMTKHVASNDIEAKVASLILKSDAGKWSDDDTSEWEKIDDLLRQGRKAAEAICPAKKSGSLPWSPELDRAGKNLLYWKIRCREFTSGKTNTAFLEELATSLQLPSDSTEWKPSHEVRAEARKARCVQKKVKQDAADLRESHMSATAKLASALHGSSEASARRSICARELSSRQFKSLRTLFNGTAASGLDKIDVPNSYAVLRKDEPIPRISLVVKEEIEEVLLPHTERRFRQHQETPFGQGDRRRRLGLNGDSTDVGSILDGTYDHELDKLSEEAREWLTQLKRKDFADLDGGGIISTLITPAEWISGWSKMRESTASAPGGHYGHYKTAAVAARLPEDHPDHSTTLSTIYSAMWSLPLKHGFAPTRWCHCIDAIIEKIPGKPIIEKLRIIMLYEADFNFVLKFVWGRRLVRNAELHNSLGTANHGSRPGRQTTDALVEKVLIYEHARLTRTSLITVDNDAKSCYDRIIKTLAMISCMAVGLPLPAAIMHNRTHQAMVHQIKSRHGLLRPYSGTTSDGLEGAGQGSGSGPAIWLIYIVSLIAAFRKFSPGINILNPHERTVIFILAVFFVDDGMPGVNDALEEVARPLPELLTDARKASQSWERLLFASGGALELSKCFAYVMYWDLSNGTHRLIAPDEIPGALTDDTGTTWGPLSLTYGDTSEEQHKLATEAPWVGRRTLGVRLAPAGTWDQEYSFRRSQSRELALKIAGATISRATARVAYRSIICPKLEFPLAVTQFTQQQCDSIASPVLGACLSKMGYNCNMPREVVYGPVELGGLGLHDLYIEQGLHQLTTLIGHTRQKSVTGNMMLSELAWCQVQAGIADHLLESPDIPVDYIETCWIMSIRDFLSTYGFRMKFSQDSRPSAQCNGDEFLMDAFRTRGDCSSLDLQRLNACRMYLRVARISDIASADGKSMRPDALAGKQLTFFVSASSWPRQGRPPKPWWNLWRHKLRAAFSRDGSSPIMRTQLGSWNEAVDTSEWSIMATTSPGPETILVKRPDGQYDSFGTVDGRGQRVHAYPTQTITVVPKGSIPVSLGKPQKNKQRRVYRRGAEQKQETQPAYAATFVEYIDQQDPHVRALMTHCDKSEEATARVVGLLYSANSLHSGTDGGLADGIGTFGFVWGDAKRRRLLATGKGYIPGSPHSTRSTRTEMGGILSSITYLRLIVGYYSITLPRGGIKCTIHCDSKAAIRRLSSLTHESFGTSWRCREDYDIEAAILSCLSTCRTTVTWNWVQAHASRRKQTSDFTWPETLNETADSLATEARLETSTNDNERHWPEQHTSIIGPRGPVSGILATELRYCCTASDIQSYYKTRHKWTTTSVNLLDSIGLKVAISNLRPDSARRYQKLRCGWLPVNTRESRLDPDRPPGCSACSPTKTEPETVDHIFQCPSSTRKQLVGLRLTALPAEFAVMRTAECIASAILTGARAWADGAEPPPAESLDLPNTLTGRITAQAYDEQSILGWNNFFRGFWTESWRLAQEAHLTADPGRTLNDTSARWSGKAQLWFITLFETVWGLRCADEHGADPETELLIRSSKCEAAIRRLYDKGSELPHHESHPFRTDMADLLSASVIDQELWINQTEAFLVNAFRRIRTLSVTRQPVITDFFLRSSR